MKQLPQILYVTGDATEPDCDGPKIIPHCCNDEGYWGKGFVLSLSRKWPVVERMYRRWHDGEMIEDALNDHAPTFKLGSVLYVAVDLGYIANIIGQHGIARRRGDAPIHYNALTCGLENVGRAAKEIGATVHMPKIGCGLAGGVWEKVASIVQDAICCKGVNVYVYVLPKEAK